MFRSTGLIGFQLLAVSCLAFGLMAGIHQQAGAAELDFQSEVLPLFTKYCSGCHNPTDKEGDFVSTSYEGIMAGTPEHRVVLPNQPDDSRLIQLVSGKLDIKMPPEDHPQPSNADVQRMADWIRQGANPSSSKTVSLAHRLGVPSPTFHREGPLPATAISEFESDSVVVGRYGQIELYTTHESEIALKPHYVWKNIVGKVAQLRRSPDGKYLIAASGISGVGGQVTLIEIATKQIWKQWEANQDALFAAAMSPDLRWVALGGYDRVVTLWDIESQKLVRSFQGHNGAIYDLDFDLTGEILATASADETVKLWRVETGERLDTLGQPEGEQYSVRFDATGRRVAAAGADRRIRIWKVLSRNKPTINPLLHSAFAHEGSVLAIRFNAMNDVLASAGEDRQLKLWAASNLEPFGEIKTLADIPTSIDTIAGKGHWVVAAMDGSTTLVNASTLPNISRASLPNSERHVTETDRDMPTGPMLHASPTELREIEANNSPAQAQKIQLPAHVQGVIQSSRADKSNDEDWFAFDAVAGDSWLLDVKAARNGSLLDSKIEVCDELGKPVLRTRLQALRESYLTFRGKNSDTSDDFRMHNWQDMELNEWLYAGGEVVRLWLYPRGPDSGFKVYPGFGNRFAYFDTTPTSHPMGAPTWIVRELGARQNPIPNGLPVFPIYFENDDDSKRRFGKDSQLHFTAPKSGQYFVRLRDARGMSGERFSYQLSIVPLNPRFAVSLIEPKIAKPSAKSSNAKSKTNDQDKEEPPAPEEAPPKPKAVLSVAPGSGAEFEVQVERWDDFDGPISIELQGLPENLVATQPLTIEAGQLKAFGTIYCPEDITLDPDGKEIQLIARARIGGKEIVQPMTTPFWIQSADKPRMKIDVLPRTSSVGIASDLASSTPNGPQKPVELRIRPGETIAADIRVHRGTFQGNVDFGKEDSGRNLPHGVIVDNVGLSGLLIPEGKDTREFFLTAAPWLSAQERFFHLRVNGDGKPTTIPILLKVVDRSE